MKISTHEGSYLRFLTRNATEENCRKALVALDVTLNHFNIHDKRDVVSEALLRLIVLNNESIFPIDSETETLFKMLKFFKTELDQ